VAAEQLGSGQVTFLAGVMMQCEHFIMNINANAKSVTTGLSLCSQLTAGQQSPVLTLYVSMHVYDPRVAAI
jgi:hypothetical protein